LIDSTCWELALSGDLGHREFMKLVPPEPEPVDTTSFCIWRPANPALPRKVVRIFQDTGHERVAV
jgi:hypothetical protein